MQNFDSVRKHEARIHTEIRDRARNVYGIFI